MRQGLQSLQPAEEMIMDTPAYPCERFLAYSRRSRSSKIVSILRGAGNRAERCWRCCSHSRDFGWVALLRLFLRCASIRQTGRAEIQTNANERQIARDRGQAGRD